jgi:Ca2+-binding EF-hand superfamily protein
MATSKKTLSEADIAQVREIFSILDKEKKNHLPAEDLKILLCILGIPASLDDCRVVCLEYAESPQKVSFETVLQILESYKVDFERGKPMRLAFKILNVNESGYVKKEDVMRVLKILGESRAREDFVEGLLRQTSLFENDEINFVDFLTHMMKY